MSERSGDNPLLSAAEKLRSELDRWLDVALTQGEKALDRFGLRPGSGNWCPDVDVIEQSDRLVVLVDLPGVAPEDIDVAISGSLLTLAGRRSVLQSSEKQPMHLRERRTGEFRRSISLPVTVDADKTQAELRAGILKIVLPKSEQAMARKIVVTDAEPTAAAGASTVGGTATD